MLNMNLFAVILLVVIQHTRQYEYTSDSLNMDCGTPLISLVKPQTKTDKGYPGYDYHNKNIFRLNKPKHGYNKGKKAVAIPVLLMSNSAFSDIKGSTFNFKDIESFKIDQGSDNDKNRKLKHEDSKINHHNHRHKKLKNDEDSDITNDDNGNRKLTHGKRPRDSDITNDDNGNRKLTHGKRPRDHDDDNDDNTLYFLKPQKKNKHNKGFSLLLGKLWKK